MKPASQFNRPQGRAEFERARNEVRAMLNEASADDALAAIVALDHEFDAGVLRVKAELLGSTLCWKPDDRELSSWIYDQHCELAETARRAADLFERRAGCDDTRTVRLIALAFLHWGEASKWVVGRRAAFDYSWMNWLMRLATSAHRNLEPCEVRLEGRNRTVPLESLFLRTLLLDRFAGGNLTRQQIEVLDAWLWDWMPDLKAVAMWPGEAAFRADLDGKGGLRTGRRADEGAALYLPIAPLEARRRAVIGEFHRGRIVPSSGVAADFRVEEHVALLEQLRSVFMAASAEAFRVPRAPASRRSVEIWLGLSDILGRGLATPVPTVVAEEMGGRKPALSDTQRLRRVQFLDEYEQSRRFMRLVDESETGFGFDATEKEATGIAVGDLVAIRLSDDEPCVVGRIVRRVPGATEGELSIGVRTLSRAAQAVSLSRAERQNRPDDDDLFVYVPGNDASGSRDAFIVPEKVALDGEIREAVIGLERFTLQFNRVLCKGRGWALAGFEILAVARLDECKPVEAKATPVPQLELAPDYTDAWDRELSARLLD